jgi:hypothetical protein
MRPQTDGPASKARRHPLSLALHLDTAPCRRRRALCLLAPTSAQAPHDGGETAVRPAG